MYSQIRAFKEATGATLADYQASPLWFIGDILTIYNLEQQIIEQKKPRTK